MQYKEEIKAWVDAHRAEFLEDLKRLVAIDSVMGEACKAAPEEGAELTDAPFGPGPLKALAAAEKLIKQYGFTAKNYDNYVVTADLNDGERALDILAHLDVVPAQEGWTVTEAFEPLVREEEGKIYGRGTSDDKGPALAALYAMRAVKELGIPVSCSARLILGTNEENGSACIAHYYKTEKEAPMSVSPDAEYPVINIEKGRMPGVFGATWHRDPVGARILSITGGTIANAVPSRASAVVGGISRMVADVAAAEFSRKLGIKFTIEAGGGDVITEKEAGTDTLLTINALGKNAHAAMPQGGLNALTGLLLLLSGLLTEEVGAGETGVPTGDAAALQSLIRLMPHGETDGTSLGLKTSDPESGDLTLTFSQLSWNESGLRGLFDCRYPASLTAAEVCRICAARFAGEGFWFDGSGATEPHRVPADSRLVKSLTEIYEAYTGLPGDPVCEGGSTYVHDLKNGVAFGAVMPGTDTRMHGPDEFAVIGELLLTIEMYAQAIAELCNK